MIPASGETETEKSLDRGLIHPTRSWCAPVCVSSTIGSASFPPFCTMARLSSVTEGEERQLIAVPEAVIDAGLIVPVDGSHRGYAIARVVGQEERQEEIDVAAPSGDGALRVVPERPLDESDGLQEVHREAAVQGGIGFPGSDVERGGEVSAVVGAVPAWIEVDAVDELLVDDRGPAEEVVEDRDPVAVEIGPRVLRRGPPNQEQPGPERRAREAGQGLHGPDRVVERAGNVHELLVLEGPDGGVLLRSLPLHHGGELADRSTPQLDPDLGGAPGSDVQLAAGFPPG